MTLSALTAATAPTSANVTWSKTWTSYLTAKAARPVGTAGNLAVLLYGELATQHATVTAVSGADGAELWAPKNIDEQFEGTDLQVAKDGDSFVIVGQGGANKIYDGLMTKVMMATGDRVWTKKYSSCGTGAANDACNKKLV